MNLVFFSVVMVIIVYLFIRIVSSPVQENQDTELLDEINPSKLSIHADYVGGLDTVLEKTKCSLILMKDKINLRIDYKGVDILIPFNKIKNIKTLNEKDLMTNSSTSKFFEEKKVYINKKSNEELIVITYFDSIKNEEQILVLEYSDSKSFLNKYKEVFDEWICGQFSDDELSIDMELQPLM